jgi:myo-inositol-hexaphosphate 3-phosphohydrolase
MQHHGVSQFVLSLAPVLAIQCAERPEQPSDAPAFLVTARGETSPAKGDPDDSAIWQHPSDPGKSLIITTNKTVGLQLYALDGTAHQEVHDGGMNNVDLRMSVDEAALDPQGVPALTLRRTLQFGGGLEGCVGDDELARLYLGQEELGVWRVGAEPDSDDAPVLLHGVDDPYLTADIEGMTLYYAANGQGYLLVSSQGSNTYAVFERGGDNAYLTSFRVGVGSLDAAVETDGVEISNVPLGPLWPDGLFIAHDDHNEGFSRNFKLVGWRDVVAAADVELLIDVEHRVGP